LQAECTTDILLRYMGGLLRKFVIG